MVLWNSVAVFLHSYDLLLSGCIFHLYVWFSYYIFNFSMENTLKEPNIYLKVRHTPASDLAAYREYSQSVLCVSTQAFFEYIHCGKTCSAASLYYHKCFR